MSLCSQLQSIELNHKNSQTSYFLVEKCCSLSGQQLTASDSGPGRKKSFYKFPGETLPFRASADTKRRDTRNGCASKVFGGFFAIKWSQKKYFLVKIVKHRTTESFSNCGANLPAVLADFF